MKEEQARESFAKKIEDELKEEYGVDNKDCIYDYGHNKDKVVKVARDEKWLPCYFKPCSNQPHSHEVLRGYVNSDKTVFRIDGCDYRWQEKDVLEYTISAYEGKNYRPFNSIEELFSHWTKKVLDPKLTLLTLNNYSGCLFRPDIWVRRTDTGTETLITSFSGNLGKPCVCLIDKWMTMQEMFANYTFLDGTPFGKEIQE